ncbi:MAG TPA: dihydrolipoamide acetyltransferase family protein [Solirubrobacteraceae bacterium]|nr:dihydrolipoamide acetyltransferase family protein [Solirubrobacteraceae bacterium]
MSEIAMPRLSDSMEEGTIIKWLKAEGDEVARGDELVEIETDKATMTYEADTDGVLQIVAAEGDTLPVGEVIARLNGAAGAAGDGASGVGRRASEGAEPEAEPAPPPEPEPEPEPEPAQQSNGGERVKASPIARRMAREKGLDLSSLSGTGPGGRIVKADVEGATAPTPNAQGPTPETPTPDTQTGKGSSELVELTRTQQLIARRMAESKATVPDFALDMDIDMAAAVAMRAQLKDVAEVVPSFNDMVVKACALALREYPRANGSYKDGRYELHARVNVGVAVAAQDALIVPTVFDADRKSLGEIARATRELAGKVREGTIAPPDLSGGTFTVSNLGMYGITSFTAVINPPQAAILAVGAIEQRPVVVDGEIVPRHRMAVTLACDHRILYGADAAQFLARIRDLLQAPASLAL